MWLWNRGSMRLGFNQLFQKYFCDLSISSSPSSSFFSFFYFSITSTSSSTSYSSSSTSSSSSSPLFSYCGFNFFRKSCLEVYIKGSDVKIDWKIDWKYILSLGDYSPPTSKRSGDPVRWIKMVTCWKLFLKHELHLFLSRYFSFWGYIWQCWDYFWLYT